MSKDTDKRDPILDAAFDDLGQGKSEDKNSDDFEGLDSLDVIPESPEFGADEFPISSGDSSRLDPDPDFDLDLEVDDKENEQAVAVSPSESNERPAPVDLESDFDLDQDSEISSELDDLDLDDSKNTEEEPVLPSESVEDSEVELSTNESEGSDVDAKLDEQDEDDDLSVGMPVDDFDLDDTLGSPGPDGATDQDDLDESIDSSEMENTGEAGSPVDNSGEAAIDELNDLGLDDEPQGEFGQELDDGSDGLDQMLGLGDDEDESGEIGPEQELDDGEDDLDQMLGLGDDEDEPKESKDEEDYDAAIDHILDESDDDGNDPMTEWGASDLDDDSDDDIFEPQDDEELEGDIDDSDFSEFSGDLGDLESLEEDLDANSSEIDEDPEDLNVMLDKLDESKGEDMDIEKAKDEIVEASKDQGRESTSTRSSFFSRLKKPKKTKKQTSSPEKVSKSNSFSGFAYLAVAIASGVGSAYYFTLDDGPINPTVSPGELNNLAARVSSEIQDVNSRIEEQVSGNDERYNRLLSDYQELSQSQSALISAQRDQQRLISSLRDEAVEYEGEMLSRLERLLVFTRDVAERQDAQSVKVKDEVMREAIALLEERAGDEDAERLMQLSAQLRDSVNRINQIEASVLAQRNRLSMVESETEYVKERVGQGSSSSRAGIPSILAPINNSETPTGESGTESEDDDACCVHVELGDDRGRRSEQRSSGDERSTSAQPESEEERGFEYYVMGVFSKGNGAYDIYLQSSNASNRTDFTPYFYNRNNASTLPGYGRILGVERIDDGRSKIPYVIMTEKGDIRGRE